MAISSTLTKNTWPGNGVATLFPFHFRINEADHLAVIVADASGAETELDPSLYAVIGAGGDEGSVAYPLTGDPLPAGWSITLARRTPRTQETDLDNQGGLYLKEIERTVDGLTMMVQEQQEQIDRSAKMPISSPNTADELIDTINQAASAAEAAADAAQAAAGTAAAEAVALASAAISSSVSAANNAKIAAQNAQAAAEAAADTAAADVAAQLAADLAASQAARTGAETAQAGAAVSAADAAASAIAAANAVLADKLILTRALPCLDLRAVPDVTPMVLSAVRADAGHRTNAKGLLESVALNVLRHDFDPVTGEYRGWLVEGARTNLLLNSATLSAQSVSVTAQAYALSFYGSGSIALSGAHTATLAGAGLYPSRATLTFTPSAGTLTLTVTGTVQNAQIEAAAFPSSFIATGGAAATRAADLLSVPLSSVPGFNTAEGAVFVEAEFAFPGAVSGVSETLVHLDDGSSSNRIMLWKHQTGALYLTISKAGVQVVSSALGAAPTGRFRVAASWSAADYAVAVNGALVSHSPVAGAVPAGITTINIGKRLASSDPFFGRIRRVALFPRAIGNDVQLVTG